MRAAADAGIAERGAALKPPPDSIVRMLSVGSFSLRSSRCSARSGWATRKSFFSAASTFGISSIAFSSVGVNGVTSS